MYAKILGAASVAVLLSLSPAIAQTSAENHSGNVEKTWEKAWDSTKEAVKETTESLTDKTKETYKEATTAGADEKVEFSVLGADQSASVETSVNARMTADGILGEPIKNTNNERVGTMKDIVLDQNGVAQTVVVSDADLIDVGVTKDAAFDYSLVTRKDPEGDIIMPLTEEMIDQARAFSSSPDEAGKEGTSVMPISGLSVAKLLEAEVVDQENNKIGSVDNITFKGGRADKILVDGGMDTGKVALDMTSVKINQEDKNSLKVQLDATQSAQLANFKQKSSSN